MSVGIIEDVGILIPILCLSRVSEKYLVSFFFTSTFVLLEDDVVRIRTRETTLRTSVVSGRKEVKPRFNIPFLCG